ncbi:hypothetical protein SBRCBS47491_003925 [Sporothrix bragantina]|uniref:Alcohol dehydrogenase n=1 Tax=Sporothrix bragantina TaxID=671064 RepID=A0ABP0BJ41_9PEZI
MCPHSDVYNMMGYHPMDVHIPGHEGVGVVVQVGSRTSPDTVDTKTGTLRLGQRVGIKWIHETCGACPICERNNETACPQQHNSGRDRDGTLQQFVTVPARHATPIPDGISSEMAAPLLCGASAFFDFADPDLEHKVKSLTSSVGAHAVVCSPGSEVAYNQGIKLLRPGGTLVCVGLPSSRSYCLPLSPMDMVNRGLHVIGSAVGTETEMQELLQLASQGVVVPQMQVMPLSRFEEAIEVVKTSKASGKVVLKMP